MGIGVFDGLIFDSNVFDTGDELVAVQGVSAGEGSQGRRRKKVHHFQAPLITAKIQSRIRAIAKKISDDEVEDLDKILAELAALQERMRLAIVLSTAQLQEVEQQKEYLSQVARRPADVPDPGRLTERVATEREKQLAVQRAERIILESQRMMEEAIREQQEAEAAAVAIVAFMELSD